MSGFGRRPSKQESGGSSTSSAPPGGKTSTSGCGSLPRWEDRLRDEAFRKMSLAELKTATNNFDKRNLLGSGGFGDVYRGHGPQGQEYAVKRARPGVVVKAGTSQGVKDFEREVVTMSQLAHKHLVRLLGYCTDKGENIVVYELMEGGSLAAALHGVQKRSLSRETGSAKLSGHSSMPLGSSTTVDLHSRSGVWLGKKIKSITEYLGSTKSEVNGKLADQVIQAMDSRGMGRNGSTQENGCAIPAPPTPLSFLQRVDIATGTAEALHYLHSALATPVVHRDIKPDNILLDSKMRAKLGDFGLVKLMRGGAELPSGLGAFAESTRITGTRGYLDPDYWSEGKASPAVDVFSFGVVMLELLTGRKPLVSEISDLNAMLADVKQSQSGPLDSSGELSGLNVSIGSYSHDSLASEPLHGQQVPLREWVDHVLRSTKRLHAVVDPTMDLDLGVSVRALRTLEDANGKGVSAAAEEAYNKRKEEAVEKGLKAFLQLALKCTGKSARRPPMAEVATQLQQIRRELRAARENQA